MIFRAGGSTQNIRNTARLTIFPFKSNLFWDSI